MSSNIIPFHAGEFGVVSAPKPQIFDFGDYVVRVVDRDGEPWFVLADLCRVLGIRNPSDAAKRLEEDERNTLDSNEGIISASVGNPNKIIVSESGAMATILSSRKPEAKAFRKWVTGTVLPSIRKTGAYVSPDATIAGVAAAASLSRNVDVELYMRALESCTSLVDKFYSNLGETAKQALLATLVNKVTGDSFLSAPATVQHTTTTDLATALSVQIGRKVSNQVLGKWANNQGAKIPTHGENRLTKALHSDRQCEQWFWSPAGVDFVMANYR